MASVLFASSIVARLPWQKAPAPVAPEPSAFDYAAPIFLSVAVCWVLPALFYILSITDGQKAISPVAKLAVDGTGAVVPKDTERRKEAQSETPAQAVGMQRLMMALAFIVPHMIVCALQTGPTVSEQVGEWMRMSYDQLTDGKLTLPFQIAVAGAAMHPLALQPVQRACHSLFLVAGGCSPLCSVASAWVVRLFSASARRAAPGGALASALRAS